MKFVAEYIWIDAVGNCRSKSRTVSVSCSEEDARSGRLMDQLLSPSLYEDWTYDGSSTGQGIGSDSDVILKAVYVCVDPFRKAPNVMVLCDTYLPSGEPTPSNHRHTAKKVFDQYSEQKPWYGLGQEFFLMKGDNPLPSKSKPSVTPFGVTELEIENPQGQYYCSVGAENAFGRKVTEQAYHLALEASLVCSGMNAEVAPSQWEIQIGPVEGIEAADQLVLLRYIMQRVGEVHGVQINLHPKPIKGNWNGSGCHTNFSTKAMREDGGYQLIIDAVEKLKSKHVEHMAVYGEHNNERMTGEHETSGFDNFSYGVAHRGCSVRIPRGVEIAQKGYFEDRRPASNMDPYLVTSKILDSVMS